MPFGSDFAALSALREGPTVEEVERLLGGSAEPVSRTDRHRQVRFANGAVFIQVVPPVPDGRTLVDPGMLAAYVAPMESQAGCITPDSAGQMLVDTGWSAPAPLSIERHSRGEPGATPAFTRHDGLMTLYLFAGEAGARCVNRYALLWRLEIAGLARLAPELAR